MLLGAALLVRTRAEGGKERPLSRPDSLELKGFAILAVVFGHIGYILFAGGQFLFPLSTLAGVGVDLFLFLSGYGLAASALAHKRSLKDFYLRHAKRIYIPLWIALTLLFLADSLLLDRSYSLGYIAQSFLGYFPHADPWADVDSPLWYFTYVVFLYALFPLVFSARRPWLSALAVAALTCVVAYLGAPFVPGVAHFYQLHTLAFPLGMLAAWVLAQHGSRMRLPIARVRQRLLVLAALFAAVLYLAIHSGVGTAFEQYVSLATLALVVAFFVLKQSSSRLLLLLGSYSYEIYLLHWPLLSRYDVLYPALPAFAATALYLAGFALLGYALQRRNPAM